VEEFDPQFVPDKTLSKFKAFRHLVFRCLICGIKESFLSNIIPKNLASSTTGILEPDLVY
jgi:hypothetical protein